MGTGLNEKVHTGKRHKTARTEKFPQTRWEQVGQGNTPEKTNKFVQEKRKKKKQTLHLWGRKDGGCLRGKIKFLYTRGARKKGRLCGGVEKETVLETTALEGRRKGVQKESGNTSINLAGLTGGKEKRGKGGVTEVKKGKVVGKFLRGVFAVTFFGDSLRVRHSIPGFEDNERKRHNRPSNTRWGKEKYTAHQKKLKVL